MKAKKSAFNVFGPTLGARSSYNERENNLDIIFYRQRDLVGGFGFTILEFE